MAIARNLATGTGLVLAGLLLAGSGAIAQPTEGGPHPSSQLGLVVGQVINQAGQPVAGAQIRVSGSRDGNVNYGLFDRLATTDSSGAFEIDGGLPGRWLLSIDHPDYETLTEEVWLFSGLTTPVEVRLSIPIRPQPRTRVGVIGVGTLAHTEFLSQRLAAEAVRLGLVPNTERVLPLDNRNLQPILEKIGSPLFDILEHDEIEPEDVNQFFDFLGLEALVVAKVDVLSRAISPDLLRLKSRSRLELWTIDSNGRVQVREIASEDFEEDETSDLNVAELEQIYQIQVTRMATEIGEDWQEKERNPLARFTEVDPEAEPTVRTSIDTTVELVIPGGDRALDSSTPAFPAPVAEEEAREETEGEPEDISEP